MIIRKTLRLSRCVFINLHLVNPVAEFCISHFQETYNIVRIQYADKFGINVSGKNNPHPNVISAELCEVIQGQVSRLSSDLTSINDTVGSAGSSSVNQCKVETFASGSIGAEGTAISVVFPASSVSSFKYNRDVSSSFSIRRSLQTPPIHHHCFPLHNSFQS